MTEEQRNCDENCGPLKGLRELFCAKFEGIKRTVRIFGTIVLLMLAGALAGNLWSADIAAEAKSESVKHTTEIKNLKEVDKEIKQAAKDNHNELVQGQRIIANTVQSLAIAVGELTGAVENHGH